MMRPARRASLLVALCLLTSAATAHAESKWALWKHSYEVWIDTNKVSHRRDVAWKKVNMTTAKSDCDDRRVSGEPSPRPAGERRPGRSWSRH